MQRVRVIAAVLITVCFSCDGRDRSGGAVDGRPDGGRGDVARDSGADSGRDANGNASEQHLCTYESCPDDPGPYGGSSAKCPSVPPREHAACTLEEVDRCYYCDPGQDVITADESAEEYGCVDGLWVIDTVVNACH